MTRKLFKIQILLAAKKANVSIKRNKMFKRLQLPSHSVSIEPNATYYNAQTIFSMGAYSYSRSALPVDTVVGRYCSIGSGVTALRVDHPLNRFTTSTITYCKKSHKNNLFKTIPYLPNEAPIIIGHDVWIGEGVKIKKGVTIGNGAVIGANSIVTKDIPPYSIAVGSPAKVVKYRFEQDTIDQLIDSEWWNYDLNQINIPLDSSPIDIINAVKKLKPIKYKAIKI